VCRFQGRTRHRRSRHRARGRPACRQPETRPGSELDRKEIDEVDPRADTTVLSGDLAAAIGELKAKPGGELQVHGSGALFRWLLENDLVDEINLLIVPVVLGQGTRLFPDAGPDIALDLVDSRADSKGVTIQVYRPSPDRAVGIRSTRFGERGTSA
jgi:riboflavin biosynthesis pyrimidine reductase